LVSLSNSSSLGDLKSYTTDRFLCCQGPALFGLPRMKFGQCPAPLLPAAVNITDPCPGSAISRWDSSSPCRPQVRSLASAKRNKHEHLPRQLLRLPIDRSALGVDFALAVLDGKFVSFLARWQFRDHRWCIAWPSTSPAPVKQEESGQDA